MFYLKTIKYLDKNLIKIVIFLSFTCRLWVWSFFFFQILFYVALEMMLKLVCSWFGDFRIILKLFFYGYYLKGDSIRDNGKNRLNWIYKDDQQLIKWIIVSFL